MFPVNTIWDKDETFSPRSTQNEESEENIWLYFKLLSLGVICYAAKDNWNRLTKTGGKRLMVDVMVAETCILFCLYDALLFHRSCKWQNLILENAAWWSGDWLPYASHQEPWKRFPWPHLAQRVEISDGLDLWGSSLIGHVPLLLLPVCLKFRWHE